MGYQGSSNNVIVGELSSTIDATDKAKGIIRIATEEEAFSGSSTNTAITPHTMKLVGDEEYGTSILLDLDQETFVLTVSLVNSNNEVLDTKTVDFPSESAFVDGRYESETKTLVLVLQSGAEIEIPLGDIINGLQEEITVDNKLSSDLVDDTNKNNKFVTVAEKELLDSISVTASEINSLDGIDDNVQDQIDVLDSVVSSNYNTLNDKIDSINGALSDSISGVDTKFDSITGGLSDSIVALDSVVSANFTTLSDSIIALDSVVSDNYTTLDNKIDSINGALSDSISGVDTKFDSITSALDDKIDSIEGALSDSIDSLSSVVSDNYNTLDSLIGAVDDKIDVHIADTNNPHSVTATQVGLGNCDNTSDADKPVSTAQQTALDGKVDKNAAITAGTKCKITYDTKGLVTAGADLEASDIPSLTLAKISDVTASASEVNILDGATLSTTELNYVDGVTSAIQTQFDNITDVIPAAASDTNQLADKDFVNSSIATNTANFIGTFNSVADLEAYSGTLTNNDYAFVIVTDGQGNTAYDRYKYTTATTPASWVFEYELNNSSFTSDQWAAINSLITADTKVTHTANTAIGDANTPVYINSSGVATALSFTIAKSVPSNAEFTDTTYSFATGTTNGTISVTEEGGTAQDIAVKGLGSAAYTSSSDYATSIQGGLADTSIQGVKVNSTALIPDANKVVDVTVPTKISDLSDDTATYPIDKADTLTGLTATITELNYVDGVTSAIQTQLDNKVAKNTAITGATKCKITYDTKGLVTAGADLQASDIPNLTLAKITDVTASASELNILDGATLTTTELNYVDGVTSSIQTQLNGKQASITGGASTITSSDLTASKALVSNASGKVAVSAVTSTELGYVSGVTSAIQTQLNGKQTTANLTTFWGSTPSDSKYPSEKLVYDTIGNLETILHTINSGNS